MSVRPVQGGSAERTTVAVRQAMASSTTLSSKIDGGSTVLFWGSQGALRIPLCSFEWLRRPRCAAKLPYFPIVRRFDPHRPYHRILLISLVL